MEGIEGGRTASTLEAPSLLITTVFMLEVGQTFRPLILDPNLFVNKNLRHHCALCLDFHWVRDH